MSADIQSVLQRLGGVYRDPTRVSRDTTNLLNNPNGRALKPSIASLVENNGTHHPQVLSLSGTIGMTYRGKKYNIPVDVYLPPAYPLRPPICFVRPVSTMVLKENHRHVGKDGMVYMPYLHEWRQYSSNLVEMVVMMSSIFGTDPPVYAKPATAAAASAASASASTAGSVAGGRQQQPPRYEDVRAQSVREEAERRAREEERERVEREAAVKAAAAAAAADEERTIREMREKLTSKIQSYLQNFYNQAREDIQSDLREQAKLDRGKNSIAHQLESLRKSKEVLELQVKHVDERTAQLTELVTAAEEAKESGEKANVDDLAVPVDPRSAQMLDLVAKNASIADCMYFLDKALVKGKIPLEVHLKQVRSLAKRQFFARAHMMKIARVQQQEVQHM